MPLYKIQEKLEVGTNFIFTLHLHTMNESLIVSDKHEIYVLYILNKGYCKQRRV